MGATLANRSGGHAHLPDLIRAGPSLSVQVLRTPAELGRLESDIRALEKTTHNVVPFAGFDWQNTWCRHFLEPLSGLVDRLMYQVIRDGDRCVALFPLISTTRHLYGIEISSIGLLGADPGITEIRSPLVEAGYEESAAAALAHSLKDAGQWDWIEWISPHDALSRVLGSARRLQWQPVASSYVINLPSTWAAFQGGLKRNIRESLRHCYNSLKRNGHGFDFRITTDPVAVPGAVARLFELHLRRAEMTGHIRHPDRFASAVIRNFIVDVCREFALRGALRVFELEILGRVVASRIGFVIGDELYLYYSGFDPAWSRFSVMTTTVAEAIKYAISQGLGAVNLSPGQDVSKTRWGPVEVPYQRAYECSHRLRSRMAHYAYLRARTPGGVRQWLGGPPAKGRRRWV